MGFLVEGDLLRHLVLPDDSSGLLWLLLVVVVLVADAHRSPTASRGYSKGKATEGKDNLRQKNELGIRAQKRHCHIDSYSRQRSSSTCQKDSGAGGGGGSTPTPGFYPGS
ncbi:MAG: hypothetical protein AAF581_13260, partial [Planctomycetota bacterium]